MALTVSRSRILAAADCSLAGDRYRVAVVRGNGQWPTRAIGDMCELIGGGTPSRKEASFWTGGSIKWISAKHISETHSLTGSEFVTEEAVDKSATNIVPSGAVVLVTRVSVGKLVHLQYPVAVNQDLTGIVPNDLAELNPRYLFWAVRSCAPSIAEAAQGLGVKGVTRKYVSAIKLPLPPLDEQERIVAELDGYRKVIEGARQVVENYKPTIQIDPAWPIKPLGEVIVGTPKNGYSGKPVDFPTGTRVLSLSATTSGELDPSKFKHLDEEISADSPVRCRKGDILLQRGNTKELVGTAALFDIDGGDYIYPDLMIRVQADETQVLSEYLVRALQSPDARFFITNHASGSAGSMPKINQQVVKEIPIPVPSLEAQREIVSAIRSELAIIRSNRSLIDIFEEKIRRKLAEVWGDAPSKEGSS